MISTNTISPGRIILSVQSILIGFVTRTGRNNKLKYFITAKFIQLLHTGAHTFTFCNTRFNRFLDFINAASAIATAFLMHVISSSLLILRAWNIHSLASIYFLKPLFSNAFAHNQFIRGTINTNHTIFKSINLNNSLQLYPYGSHALVKKKL